jgi:hypothetical protein
MENNFYPIMKMAGIQVGVCGDGVHNNYERYVIIRYSIKEINPSSPKKFYHKLSLSELNGKNYNEQNVLRLWDEDLRKFAEDNKIVSHEEPTWLVLSYREKNYELA